MKKFHLFLLTSFVVLSSCISTRNTIRNIDNNIAGPSLDEKHNSFIITKNTSDKKYAFTEFYPVNVGFTSIEDGENNQKRFLNALAGPKGETISYKLIESCCPFPTNRADIGAGMLDIYEITYPGQNKPVLVYLNKYEKGELMIPVGFTAKK
ncbi:2-dehydro-3-deoxyphosphooctonate aldolase [Flavobacterium columnare]|uniref:2-dehydro-3-deoxyphosphooctonate aldolase n=1 Tax=Flavobacterium columnare TaxID=996 RepID=A0AAI8CF92_9FLAO|nr:2-dehydro-3-deoxyphosphooctonate aldolase [Flavobacterium columnare]AMO19079.1 2-dehydro-3-deoxyphosphooctonate aldolase [Flavobacterium columnare]AUX17009.1 2-dehydro-3-deoxyphosphooctonate aldolase [Flavobacterium columnare]MEB3800758.1 2-dehydro-3-deoxyphosphooctonate aldolase [Flavobacterium columnare]OOB82470.1 2-dehydro-3-deoxyphosphooctonate aldolase [Flavobacterium columnare]PTD16303.1 2-dehydro-3-deoxyphosphooctonate aldolase [Flavobacterium columnare]